MAHAGVWLVVLVTLQPPTSPMVYSPSKKVTKKCAKKAKNITIKGAESIKARGLTGDSGSLEKSSEKKRRVVKRQVTSKKVHRDVERRATSIEVHYNAKKKRASKKRIRTKKNRKKNNKKI